MTSVAISKEAHRVASGSLDHTARVWGLSGKKDALSLDGCVRLAGHAAGVSSVCMRGEQIVTASADKTLKIWAMPSHEDLATRAAGARKAGSRKAAKIDDENASSNEETVKTRGCLATLIGHTQPVSIYPFSLLFKFADSLPAVLFLLPRVRISFQGIMIQEFDLM